MQRDSCAIRFFGGRQYVTEPRHGVSRRRARWLRLLNDDTNARHLPSFSASVRNLMPGTREYTLWHNEEKSSEMCTMLHVMRVGQQTVENVLYLVASSQAEAWHDAEKDVWLLAITGTQVEHCSQVDCEWIIRLDGAEDLARACERTMRNCIHRLSLQNGTTVRTYETGLRAAQISKCPSEHSLPSITNSSMDESMSSEGTLVQFIPSHPTCVNTNSAQHAALAQSWNAIDASFCGLLASIEMGKMPHSLARTYSSARSR